MVVDTSTANTGNKSGGAPGLNITIPPKAPTTGKKGTTALAWNGTKQVPTTDLKKSWLTLTPAERQSVVSYAASVGKTPGEAQTIWNKLVDASQATVQSGKPMSPWQILQQDMQSNIPVGAGKTPLVRSNPLSELSANAIAYQAFTKVFGRIPTAQDLAAPANIKGPDGQVIVDPKTNQPATFARAIQILSESNPSFSDRTTYSYDAQNNVKGVTTTAAINPSDWLTTSMASTYADAIKSGTAQPEATIQDQYSQLASKYGMSAFDTSTQQLTPQAKIDLAELQAGTKTLAQVKTGWANAVVPQVASAGHQGLLSGAVTLHDLASPAISRVASLLEKNPETVTVNDPYVQQYLRGDGNNIMSQAQLDSMIKSDPSWKYTQNAHAQLDDLASGILQRFGVNA